MSAPRDEECQQRNTCMRPESETTGNLRLDLACALSCTQRCKPELTHCYHSSQGRERQHELFGRRCCLCSHVSGGLDRLIHEAWIASLSGLLKDGNTCMTTNVDHARTNRLQNCTKSRRLTEIWLCPDGRGTRQWQPGGRHEPPECLIRECRSQALHRQSCGAAALDERQHFQQTWSEYRSVHLV